MPVVHLNIGANIGDKEKNIARAIEGLRAIALSEIVVSKPMRSEPWGFESENEFVNIGVNLETVMSPEQLLEECQRIEKSISAASHRDSIGSYADRKIDIDLIAYEYYVCDLQFLTLPHPRMHLRRFVLEPMAEIWPDWRHPLLKMTTMELLSDL